MKLTPIESGSRWIIEGLTDAPVVVSGDQLNELANITAFRFRGVLMRDAYGGLVLASDDTAVHVAFSDEADKLLDTLRSQSALDPVGREVSR